MQPERRASFRSRLEVVGKWAFITGLDVLGINVLMRPVYAGRGVIFALHRVVEREDETLVAGNAVTVDFLDDVLGYVRRMGWQIVDLDEACRRLGVSASRPFVCFTFDDGYRDNLLHALPVFRAHGAPMCVFVCTGFVDKTPTATVGGREAPVTSAPFLLEHCVLTSDSIDVEWGEFRKSYVLRSMVDRLHAYRELRGFGWRDPGRFASGVLALMRERGLEPAGVLSNFFLNWDEVRELSRAEGVEVGAHSITHRALARLSPEEARAEIAESRARLATELGARIDFFAYPYGGVESGPREFAIANDLGFRCSLTSVRGNLFAEHARSLQALPRVTLSMVPHAASRRFVKAALYGSRNGVMNRFSRLAPAATR
jgi:peptidoglycan/xylan/chitin deacetylase (PgdA/CDA1 family)